MAALTAALLATHRSGSRFVADSALYSGTRGLLAGPLRMLGADSTFADLSDPEDARRAIKGSIGAVVVESLSNPYLAVPDLRLVAELTHSAGGVLIVDNTVATPYHCRPLNHGADLVVHSGSKYLGGHSDTLSGVVLGSTELVARARDVMVMLGSPAAPFDCWLTARGIKTLAIRMGRASSNAEQVARFCASQKHEVRRVLYPGLPSHPRHEQARTQLAHGFGAMIALDLCGGARAVSAFVRALRWIPLAPSFGDVGTTIAYPAAMRDGMGDFASRAPGLLRLSVGIEDASDIIRDLDLGFRAAALAEVMC
jgi:cystathionine gamma-synthase/methionine-gamma-lyase